MSNITSSIVLALCLLLAPGDALGVEPIAPPDDPEVLADFAVRAHPSLAALAFQTEALKAAASAARLWSDPMLGAELSNLPVTSPILGAHAMSGLQFKLQQRFPGPGELKARARTADLTVDVAERDYDAAANDLRGEVRARYYDLALLRQLEVVTRDHLAQLDTLIAAVDAKYQVGVASQHDLLRLSLRRDRLAQTLLDFPARQQQVLAVLNGALARDPSAPVRTPGVTRITSLPTDPTHRRDAIANHPDIARLDAQAALASAEAEQARVEANPEPTVWLGYRVRAEVPNADPGINFVTAGVSLPLPFASTRRWRAMESAANLRARAADEAADGVRARLTARLAAAEAAFLRATELATAYRESLEPAALAALESTLSAYQVGRAEFADLVGAEVELLDIRGLALRAEADAAAARSTILTLLAEASPPAGDTE